MYECDEKERKSEDHDDRESNIRIRMKWSIVSEHDLNVGEVPPEPEGNDGECEIDEDVFPRREEFFEIGEHSGIEYDMR